MPDTALDLAALLAELGFDLSETAQLAREALVEAKLTTPTKTRIDATKRLRVEETLRARFLVTCGAPACAREAKGRTVVAAAALQRCWICSGSSNRRAVQSAEAAFRQAHIRHVVIVGGSPSTHDELRQLMPAEVELRLIIGTDRRTSALARADIKWADLIMLWGSSELDHKVSLLYVNQQDHSKSNVITVNKRGIAALLEAATKHAATRGK